MERRICTPYPFFCPSSSSSDSSNGTTSHSYNSTSGTCNTSLSGRSLSSLSTWSSTSTITDSEQGTRILIESRHDTGAEQVADSIAMIEFWQQNGAVIEENRQLNTPIPINRDSIVELMNTRGVPEPQFPFINTENGPLFKCPDCDFFAGIDDLTEHHLMAHPRPMRLFACLDCSKRFGSQDVLDSHRLIYHHVDSYCFRCNFTCSGEVFIREHALMHESRMIPKFVPLDGVTLEPEPRRRISILERIDRLD